MTRRLSSLDIAIADFKRARRQAAIQQLTARLKGESMDLLAFDEVSRVLQPTGTVSRGLREIPVDAIIGSVGRYRDFTRNFLPKRSSNARRWAQVKAAVLDMSGLAPIEVFQIGDAYFVRDGNHRVSVARQLGTPTISAYVTEVKTKVPFTSADDLDELITRALYAEFLEKTRLAELRPDANLHMTFAGHFSFMLQQIDDHWRRLAESADETVSYEEAVVGWYDEVYLPLIRIIREQGILRDFPERTEADMYVLLVRHRAELEEALGWEVRPDTVASDLASSKQQQGTISRVGSLLLDAVIPGELGEGPAPGGWRRRQLSRFHGRRMFADILVALSGTPLDWPLLDQLITFARGDQDRLLGLHVVADAAAVNSPHVSELRLEFERRLVQAGLQGDFAVDVGNVARTIIRRAAWVDLIALTITHPPDDRPLSRLGSGLNLLVQQSPRPIMAVPSVFQPSALDRAILAYDGSAKADEALFLAAYMALRWSVRLLVVTVETEHTSQVALERARAYLNARALDAEYVMKQGPIAPAILQSAVEWAANLLIVGGFGFGPARYLVLGSTLDRLLREFEQPMIICR